MSQPPSSAIVPAKLKAALGSLDVKLEVELAQYRYQRSLQQAPAPSFQEQPIPAIADPNDGLLSNSPIPLSAPEPSSSSILPAAPPPVSPPSEIVPVNSPSAPIELVNFSALDTLNPDTSVLDHVPATLESDLDAIAQDEHLQTLTRSLHNPEDYLASSEALLRNVRPNDQTLTQPNWRTVLLSPRSLVPGLALLGSLFCIYLLVKPDLTPSVQVAIPPIPPPVPSPSPSPSLQQPDLAAKEFLPMNMGNLSRLQPTTSPAASPQVAPGTATTRPSPSPTSVASSPPPVALKSLPGAPVGNDEYFYVVTDYTGPAALEQAQKVFPDAYVVNFKEGARIQFAAFEDNPSAQNLVLSLKRQGIVAKVRRPQTN